MASWEDGPEYAPHQRPQSFDAPPTASPEHALDRVPSPPGPASGAPTERPHFDSPAGPVTPLAALAPVPEEERDPHQAFEVPTSTITGDSAWGSVHWNAAQPFPVATAQPAPPAVLPGAGGPAGWPAPDQPPLGSARPPAGPSPFPAPGTPAWFSPPPPYGEQPARGRVRARDIVEAATPGLCVCLAIGGLIYVLAPIMLVVAVILSARVRAAQRLVRLTFRGAAGLLGLIGFASLFSDAAVASGWWTVVGLWALALCWVMLVVLLLLVRSGLVRGGAPPPGRSPWG